MKNKKFSEYKNYYLKIANLKITKIPLLYKGIFYLFTPLFWRHLLSRKSSTIGILALNDSVRNGKRCDHYIKPPEQRSEYYLNQMKT